MAEQGDAAGECERGLEGLGQPLAQFFTHPQPVHHHFNGVVAPEIELRRIVHFAQGAIHPGAHEAARHEVGEQLAVLALAVADHRRHEVDGRAFGQPEHLIDHFADGLRGQLAPVNGAARHAGAGEQQAHVVVDFGDRRHGGARIVRGGSLFDGDGRRKPFDVIHVGLAHHAQELARVGRKRLHVAPLAFGVDGVEGQRGLAGPGQAGDHDQPVARQGEIDSLEVVRARRTDANITHGSPPIYPAGLSKAKRMQPFAPRERISA